METRNGKFCMRGWKPRYQISRAVNVYFIMRIAKQEDKMKRLIALTLVILSLVGLAACKGKEDGKSTTRSYVENLWQTIPEITSDLNYYTIARRQVIYYFTEGLTDKDKLMHEVLEALVCKLEVEGTEYDIAQWQTERCEEEFNQIYQKDLHMKKLIESKGLDYTEVIKSRCQYKYCFFLQNCVMKKWGNVDKDSISGSGATGQELLDQFNELQDKKVEQLHKVMNRKYHFDKEIEKLFVEIFGKDYEHKTYDAWYRKALEEYNKTTTTVPATRVTIPETETSTILYQSNPSLTRTRGEKYSRKFVPNKYDKYNNNIDKSVATSYAASDLVKVFLSYTLLDSRAVSYVLSFKDFTHKYPTDCVRSLDGNLYAVYRINEGGYFYAFFSDEMLLSHTAYMTRKNSFADFADIKKGTSLADFAAVEPAAATAAEFYKGSKFSPSFTLILTDGLLSVSFEPSGDSFAVKNISYQPGKIQVVNNDSFYVELNYGILDKDLPD